MDEVIFDFAKLARNCIRDPVQKSEPTICAEEQVTIDPQMLAVNKGRPGMHIPSIAGHDDFLCKRSIV